MEKPVNDAFIIGEKIYLRAVEQKDTEMIRRIENHPDPRKTLFYSIPTNDDQQTKKINSQIDDPNTILFTICDKETTIPIGEAAFVRIDWISRAAVYYIGIADKENWAKGFGTETTNLMINYAFNTLNLNRIQLHVAIENIKAVKVYEKCGFNIEGKLRQAMFHEGKYEDFYVMGMLLEDFKNE